MINIDENFKFISISQLRLPDAIARTRGSTGGMKLLVICDTEGPPFIAVDQTETLKRLNCLPSTSVTISSNDGEGELEAKASGADAILLWKVPKIRER